MPSRRPPSQRDPAYALHRLPGTVAQVAPGLKVKNATPVKTATPSRKAAAPAASGGAGGVLGYCELSASWSTSPTSNGTAVAASSISIFEEHGTHGVTIPSGTGIRLCDDSVESVYTVDYQWSLLSITNSTSTDVHELYLTDAIGPRTGTFLTTAGFHMPQTYRLAGPQGPFVEVAMTCTGGTNRVYDIEAFITVTRWAI